MKTKLTTLATVLVAFAAASSASAQSAFTKITTGPIVTDLGLFFGAAWGDYDKDGFIDLVVTGAGTSGNRIKLYHNNRDGTFTTITGQPIATDTGEGFGVAWADYDNDGNLDLFIANWNRGDFLYHNNGTGVFDRVTSGPVVSDNTNTNSGGGAWGDYDGDGWLDLVVAGSGIPGQNELLYHGNGDGTFTRINTGPIVTAGRTSEPLSWGDMDNDGDLDLVIANANSPGESDFLFRNDGGGSFTRLTSGPVVTDADTSNGVAWGDYDNDGDLDLAVTCSLGAKDRLYRNDGAGNFELITTTVITQDTADSAGLAWGDYDNDGWLDLFVPHSKGTPNRLFRNLGDGTFEAVTEGEIVTEGGISVGCAWGDYDNDGFLDLVVVNPKPSSPAPQKNYLYRNNGNGNRWLLVKLIGSVSNRSAIGAKVRVKATMGGKAIEQMRELNGGTINQNDLRAHFGLGDATVAETLRVEWPSGIVQEFKNVATKQILTVVEPPRLRAVTSGRVQVQGARDIDYALEVSDDLTAWAGAGLVKGGSEYVDPDTGSHAARYYRARVPSE